MLATTAMLPVLLSLPSTIRALPIMARATSQATYISNAVSAVGVLNNDWFSASTGLWENLWWNSANALTTIADLALIDSSYVDTATGIFENVFTAAQAENGGTWLNDYYDDEGW